jgi:lipoprotein-anchoring transpeptidase ErfK/SrfK
MGYSRLSAFYVIGTVIGTGLALYTVPSFAAGMSTHQSPSVSGGIHYWLRKPFINGHYVLGPTMSTNGYHANQPVVVVVDKGSHLTNVLQLQQDEIVRTLTVSNAVGKGSTPTPPGRYKVASKEMYPIWTPPKDVDPQQRSVAPYNQTHKNPLGVARISLNKFDIALHGTNAPRLIRESVSHGCVRHSNQDIIKVYGLVKPGTVVYIVNRWRGKVINQQDFGIYPHRHSRRHVS